MNHHDVTRGPWALGGLALTVSLTTVSCAPSMGARLGGTVITTPDKPLATGDVTVMVATRDLPILGVVATAMVGPYTHSYLGGVEVNAPFARGIGRDVYPQVVWGRAGADVGSETIRGKSGAEFRLSGGLSYPLFIIPNPNADAWHIVQLGVAAHISSAQTVEYSAGPVLEYVFVPHGQ